MVKETLRLKTNGGDGRILVAGSTTFVGGGQNGVEAHVRKPISDSGILSRLYVRLTNPPGISGGGGQPLTEEKATCTVFVSGEPTSMEVIIKGDSAIGQTIDNPISVAQDETVSLRVVLSGGAEATGVTGYLTLI